MRLVPLLFRTSDGNLLFSHYNTHCSHLRIRFQQRPQTIHSYSLSDHLLLSYWVCRIGCRTLLGCLDTEIPRGASCNEVSGDGNRFGDLFRSCKRGRVSSAIRGGFAAVADEHSDFAYFHVSKNGTHSFPVGVNSVGDWNSPLLY